MPDQFTTTQHLNSTGGGSTIELSFTIANITAKEGDDLALVVYDYLKNVEGIMVDTYEVREV